MARAFECNNIVCQILHAFHDSIAIHVILTRRGCQVPDSVRMRFHDIFSQPVESLLDVFKGNNLRVRTRFPQ